jgi:ketosteroid isomerase-like protein
MSKSNSADRIAVQDVMLNYAAAVDERDRDRYAACFCPNLTVHGFGEQVLNGRDDWVAYVWVALEKYDATQHMLGPVLAQINGDRAQCRTDVQALHYLRADESASVKIAAEDQQRFTLWATYRSDMRRDGDGWLIYRHELIVRGSELA